VITSRDNPRVKRWAKLVRDPAARRQERRTLVEGPHLVAELLRANIRPLALIVSESGLARREIQDLVTEHEPIVLAERVFRLVADVEEPVGIAAEIEIPRSGLSNSVHRVFLEHVQDPSNVGAIVRSAAAFGAGEVILDRGCADAWSPKALRAGMGGQFQLSLRQVDELTQELSAFDGRRICTVVSGGAPLREADLRGPMGWIFGSEGQGVSPAATQMADLRVTIPMRAGTQSLNVAAAAAICLYEAFSRPGAASAARAGSS
jgi:TrmH family RNA methyltransferase